MRNAICPSLELLKLSYLLGAIANLQYFFLIIDRFNFNILMSIAISIESSIAVTSFSLYAMKARAIK